MIFPIVRATYVALTRYRNYTLRVKLRDKNGFEHTESFPAGNSEWLPEQTHCVACALTPKGLSTGMCKLYVGLFEGGNANPARV